VQLEDVQLKYEQLLVKYERTTDQLQRAARTERQRAKSAKIAALRQSAQQGELHNIVRSLLERVRSKRAEAGKLDGSRWQRSDRSCSRPRTAFAPSSAGNHATRPMSAVDRPVSAHSNIRHTFRGVGFRHGKQTRPLSSHWGARSTDVHSAHSRTRGLNLVLEENTGGSRLNGASQRQPVGNLGVDLSEAEQDSMIQELMKQEQVLELVKAAMASKDGNNTPELGIQLAEDDEKVEVLNEDGVWVVK
jgi:hypothetical protein